MARLTPDEIDTILRTPLIAFIATVKRDGMPHVTPVWYLYDGDRLLVAASTDSVKVRNVSGNPRASLSILDPDDHSRWVQVNGPVTLTKDGVSEVVRDMWKSYATGDDWEEGAEKALRDIDFILISITPDKVIGVFGE